MRRAITLGVIVLVLMSGIGAAQVSDPLNFIYYGGTDSGQLDLSTFSSSDSYGVGSPRAAIYGPNDEFVYYADGAGEFYRVNIETGTVEESNDLTGDNEGIDDIDYSDGYLYADYDGEQLVKVEAANLSNFTFVSGISASITSGATVQGDYVYTGDWDGTLYKVHKGNMTVAQTVSTGDPRVYSVTSDDNGSVYVGPGDGLTIDSSIKKYDAETLTLQDEYAGVTDAVNALHFSPNDNLYGVTREGEVAKVDPSDMSGEWQTQPAGATEIHGVVYASDDFVYVSSSGGSIYKLDPSDGSTSDSVTIDTHALTGPTEVDRNGAVTAETTLELEIDTWMPQDDRQDYEVILNETNTTTGDTNLTDVTDDANVTIYNITNTSSFSEPIATVNNSTDTIKSYNQTGVVAVNATWNGEQANATNLTVGPRNMSNIGIMPPSQWVPSFLEIDDTAGGHGIGSSTQWILFLVIVMSAASRMFENPWAGVGGGMLTSILIWVLGYISLGIALITVFSGLLIGAAMARTQMGRGVTRDNERSGIQAQQGNRRR